MEFSELVGKKITHIVINKERTLILIKTDDGAMYKMWHEQDCCEGVEIKDIDGDLQDLVGETILEARVDTNEKLFPIGFSDGEFLWTFYRIRTLRASVQISWLGTSNGYYSMGVSFDKG
jgi:hypothetical protein